MVHRRSSSDGHKLDEILHKLKDVSYWQGRIIVALYLRTENIMANLDALESEVGEVSGTIDSAVTLIAGLRQQIIDAGTDPEKLSALVQKLDSKQQALAAAVAKNPDEPTEPAEPTEPEPA